MGCGPVLPPPGLHALPQVPQQRDLNWLSWQSFSCFTFSQYLVVSLHSTAEAGRERGQKGTVRPGNGRALPGVQPPPPRLLSPPPLPQPPAFPRVLGVSVRGPASPLRPACPFPWSFRKWFPGVLLSAPLGGGLRRRPWPMASPLPPHVSLPFPARLCRPGFSTCASGPLPRTRPCGAVSAQTRCFVRPGADLGADWTSGVGTVSLNCFH